MAARQIKKGEIPATIRDTSIRKMVAFRLKANAEDDQMFSCKKMRGMPANGQALPPQFVLSEVARTVDYHQNEDVGA